MKNPSSKDTQVILGNGWRQFAFPRDDLEYLGTIRRGLEIGALAKDTEGHFLQVNGDMRQSLNTSRMEAMVRKAVVRIQPASVTRQPSPGERAAVVVVVKPRRRVVFPIEVPVCAAESHPG